MIAGPVHAFIVAPLVQPTVEFHRARAITGRPLVASYSFLSFYERGGGLPEHRDKSHCVVSMSVALHADAGWPLRVTDRDGTRHELRWSTGQTLLFDVEPRMANDPRGDERAFFSAIPYIQPGP